MIKCKRFFASESGCRKGNATILIEAWGLEINNVALFEKDGRKWVSMPQRMVEKDGKKEYFPYLRFTEKSRSQAFSDAAVKGIEEFIREQERQVPNEPVGSHSSSDPFEEEIPF